MNRLLAAVIVLLVMTIAACERRARPDALYSTAAASLSVATAVARTSRIACDLAIPPVPAGQVLDPGRINVVVTTAASRAVVGNVRDRAACGPTGGWHYDDPAHPTPAAASRR